MLGIVIDENQPAYERGDFLVRPILGADPDSGSLAVGERVRVGQTVRMHVRDGATADEDLREALHAQAMALGDEGAAGALLFTCNGRGSHMFDVPDHDATALEDALGVPAGGLLLRRRDRARSAGATSSTASPRRSRSSRAPAEWRRGGERRARAAGRARARRGRRRRRRHLGGDGRRRRPRRGRGSSQKQPGVVFGLDGRGRGLPPGRRRRASSALLEEGRWTRRRAGRHRGDRRARRGRCSPPSAPRSTCSATSRASPR